MTTTETRCQRCGYRRAACTCAGGPYTPVPSPSTAALLDEMPDPMAAAHVAALFGADPKSVTRWANQGRIPSFRTPGGHRRYRKADIRAVLNGDRGQPS
jgi:hypothetical protein